MTQGDAAGGVHDLVSPALSDDHLDHGLRGWQIPSQGYRGMDDPLGSNPMNKLGVVLAEIGERVEVLVS